MRGATLCLVDVSEMQKCYALGKVIKFPSHKPLVIENDTHKTKCRLFEHPKKDYFLNSINL